MQAYRLHTKCGSAGSVSNLAENVFLFSGIAPITFPSGLWSSRPLLFSQIKPAEAGADAAQESGIEDLACDPDAALSARLTYPVWIVRYTTGSNEDTRTCVDAVVLTEGASYRLHAQMPVDSQDAYLEEAERRIQTLTLE